jgi:hydrogenase-4 membrane subunit HyfE
MTGHFVELFFLLDLVAFLTAIMMHLAHRNRTMIHLYAVQSVAVAALLCVAGFASGEQSLVWVSVITFGIKAVAVPIFFSRLLRRFGTQASATSYLSTPMTLAALMMLVLFAYSRVFLPLATLMPQALGSISFNLAIIFASIFLMINRKGAFTQMIGVLSLENGIVLLAALIGIEQPIALEIGIIFDMTIWIAIGSAFIGMIHRQFGSLDTDELRHLTEED